MKQTNNAIKFLMAQYRAIFKNAYFKGMATALVLTAGLAAGQAQAKYYQFDAMGSFDPDTPSSVETNETQTPGRKHVAGEVNQGDDILVTGGDLVISEDPRDNPNIALSISGNAFGGFGRVNKEGNITVDHNDLTVTGRLYTTAGAFGGYARAAEGIATVSNNRLFYTTSANNASGSLYGGIAYGTAGAVAEGNELHIGNEGTKVNYGANNSHEFSAGSVNITDVSGVTISGTFRASSNKGYLDNLEISNNQDLALRGGIVILSSGSNTKTYTGTISGIAADNYYEINGSTVSGSGSIVANKVQSDLNYNDIVGSATGTAGQVSLLISDSVISGAGTSASQLMSITGGDVNLASGSATASYNSVEIVNSEIENAVIYGGTASTTSTTSATSKGNATASYNTVTISADNDNVVENGNNPVTYKESVKAIIIGGNATNATANSSAVVSVNNNQVIIEDNVKVVGQIYGGHAQVSGAQSISLNNNSVIIRGEVEGSIYAANNDGSSTLKTGVPANEDQPYWSFLNNDVTLENGARVLSGDIIAGAGNNSVADIQAGSTYDVTTIQAIRSDVATIAGTVNVDKDNGKLTISGFFENGQSKDTRYNPNLTTIADGAVINNSKDIEILGKVVVDDGAVLSAKTADAIITVNGNDDHKVNNLTLAEEDQVSGAGYATLEISTSNLQSYLSKDIVADSKTEDVAGKFKLESGGHLHFSDATAVELGSIQNDKNEEIGFVFGSGAGQINITGTSGDGIVDGIVSAAAIKVSKPLAFAAGYNPSTAMGDTVIKADSLVIGDGRAETNETAYTKLSQFITSGTGVSATAPIAFMSNGDITLDADAISNNGTQVGNTGNSFTIDSDLYLQNNNANITANINGDDLIVNLQGKSFYIAGNYQTSSDITVEDAGEGEFAIGKVISDKEVSGVKVKNNKDLFEGTTNVKLNGQLINKTTASNDATILVQGHGAGEVDPATNPRTFYDHHATLDLTSATLTTDKDATGTLFLKASGDATIKMNASQVNTILAGNTGDTEPNTQKFGIVLAGTAQQTDGTTYNEGDTLGDKDTLNELYPDHSVAILDLAGTGALTAQFDDFVALGSAGPEGTVNKIALNDNALIIADSADLSNRANNRNNETLNLQGAELRVDSLTVSNYNLTGDETLDITEAEITNGTYTVANSLTSANGTIKVGDNADVVLGNANVSTGTVGKNLNIDGTNASVTVQNGDWKGNAVTIADGSMTVAGSQVFDPETDQFAPASFSGSALTMTGGSLNVGDSASVYRITENNSIVVDNNYDGAGNVTFTTADISRGEVNINYGSTLTLLGDAGVSGAGIDYANDTINVRSGTLVFGEAATAAMYTAAPDGTVDVADGFGEINLSNYGTVKLTFAQGTNESFTADEANSLKKQLFSSDSFTGELLWGTLNVGNASLDIEGLGTGSITWEAFKPFADMASDVTNNELLQTTVTGVGADGDSFRGQVGNVIAATGVNGLTIDNTTSFNYAAGNNGHFATTSTGADLALTVQNGQLTLANGGIVGAITLNNSSDLNIDSPEAETIVNGDINGAEGDIFANGPVTVNGNVNVDDLEVNGGSFTSGLIADTNNQGNITANWAGIYGGTLDTNNLTVKSLEVRANEHGQASTATVADTVTINSAAEITGNSTLTAYNVQLEDNAYVRVGIESDKLFDAESNTFKFDRYEQSTGYLQAKIFGLNGGTLAIDPAYGQAASLAAIGRFDNDKVVSDSETNGGTIQGQILIGMNGALGVGTTLDELKASLADWNLTDEKGSLDANKYGAALVVGQVDVNVDNGSGILLTTQSLYGTDGTKEGGSFLRSDTVTKAAASTGLTSSGVANGMYMGDNTVTVFDVNSDGKNGSITFANNDAKLIADGGEVLVTGNVRARTPYKLFADGNGGVAVVNTSGTSSTTYTGAEDDVYITVTTLNGLLQGVLYGNDAGTVELQLNQNYRSILSGASDPVTESIAAYATGYNDWQDADADRSDELVGTTLTQDYTTYVTENGSDEGFTGQKYENYNNYFLNNTLITGNGAAAETVARLAVYGGAAQAAISAGASTYDAVSGRMGVGANGANITVADNTQGAALWLAPIYKSSDSDGFDAEGVDYGVDMDLYGVALGADYTLSNGIRFGAMFNVGSGEVDGQGAGSAVSNDFDYYGFAVYGGYTMGALSLVADISYTVADNDLEGNTAIDKVGASLDSTNLSLGVTGQYQLDFNGLSVTPHAGLRFSQIDLDDYTVDGEDIIADYDADSMNIFSIPVGVTFAKEFTGDAWTVKPSLDLTLTGNFGDDETDGTVHWAGVDNLSTNVSSEVIDNFTYGATLGVAAKTGNFSLGLGVNYTGSSNVDEFGVNANARFVF